MVGKHIIRYTCNKLSAFNDAVESLADRIIVHVIIIVSILVLGAVGAGTAVALTKAFETLLSK